MSISARGPGKGRYRARPPLRGPAVPPRQCGTPCDSSRAARAHSTHGTGRQGCHRHRRRIGYRSRRSPPSSPRRACGSSSATSTRRARRTRRRRSAPPAARRWRCGPTPRTVGDIEALIALAAEEFAPVDIYVANAGIIGKSGLGTESDWDAVLDVNLRAHIRAAQLLVPHWRSVGSGYFVSVASAAGLLTQLGAAGYAVSKHAAVGFAEWLAITYGDDGIGVSCVCPLGVETPLLQTIRGHRRPGRPARRVIDRDVGRGDQRSRTSPPSRSRRCALAGSWCCRMPSCSRCTGTRAATTTAGSTACAGTNGRCASPEACAGEKPGSYPSKRPAFSPSTPTGVTRPPPARRTQ